MTPEIIRAIADNTCSLSFFVVSVGISFAIVIRAFNGKGAVIDFTPNFHAGKNNDKEKSDGSRY